MSRNELIESVFIQLGALKRTIIGRTESGRACSLTRPQQELLFYLDKHGQSTVRVIADFMGTSSSAATQLVEGLVKLSLANRQTDPADRRLVHVTLTDKGKDQLAELSKTHRAYLSNVLDPLNDEELSHLGRLLEKINNP